jgi:hypothetical protein
MAKQRESINHSKTIYAFLQTLGKMTGKPTCTPQNFVVLANNAGLAVERQQCIAINAEAISELVADA